MHITRVVIITTRFPCVIYTNRRSHSHFTGEETEVRKANQVADVYTVGYDTSFHGEMINEKVI